jgi:Flp pilus assembly protein TadB
MSNSTHLDEIRRRALDLADKSERRWKRAILIFAAVEGTGWISFILLAWLGFSVAVLLGVAVLILYTMTFTWVVAVKEHIDICTQRILKAIDDSPHAAADKPD